MERWNHAQKIECQEWIGVLNKTSSLLKRIFDGEILSDSEYIDLEWEYNYPYKFCNAMGLPPIQSSKLIKEHKLPKHIFSYRKENNVDQEYDCQGKTIMDIASGPNSLLLKCYNFKKAYALDPLAHVYPKEIKKLFLDRGVNLVSHMGENFYDKMQVELDEVWMYNCLEHVKNPTSIFEQIIKAKTKVFRFAEPWGASDGGAHIWDITPKTFTDFFGENIGIEKFNFSYYLKDGSFKTSRPLFGASLNINYS